MLCSVFSLVIWRCLFPCVAMFFSSSVRLDFSSNGNYERIVSNRTLQEKTKAACIVTVVQHLTRNECANESFIVYCSINKIHLNVVDERRVELQRHALKMTRGWGQFKTGGWGSMWSRETNVWYEKKSWKTGLYRTIATSVEGFGKRDRFDVSERMRP
jgi:hypothetical protein